MEKYVKNSGVLLLLNLKSGFNCKQNVNNGFFLKRVLIYIRKYAILTRLDALTAEVAARR